jgi:glucose-6-phosphate 1-dehydrogenase
MRNFSVPQLPTIFVVFGATGDLMGRKIVPSLFRLYKHKRLPKHFRIVGFSRRPYGDKEFREHIYKILKQKKYAKSEKDVSAFLKLFHFEQGSFTEHDDYNKLSEHLKKIDSEWGMCTNRIFYLAVTPSFIKPIIQSLKKSKLSEPCGGKEGWARLIVEKPLGSDGKTAAELEKVLSTLKQHQIYRIDHYLGKEMVKGIMNFRFSNNLFEGIWDKDHIEKIELNTLETLGVETRGSFYDSVGALRDVGQNHLLQMLALLTMDHPGAYMGDQIRNARAHILKKLQKMSPKQVGDQTFRGQYKGFKQIKNVKRGSSTETYFKIKTFIDTPRWRGVPIIIQAGKKFKKGQKDIIITFKHPEPCMCPPSAHVKNKVKISLSSYEGITVDFWTKKPGFSYEVEKRKFEFFLYEEEDKRDYIEEYARLIDDAIAGDQTWFVSKEEVKAQWQFVDAIKRAWDKNKVKLHQYQPGSNSIVEKADKALGLE